MTRWLAVGTGMAGHSDGKNRFDTEMIQIALATVHEAEHGAVQQTICDVVLPEPSMFSLLYRHAGIRARTQVGTLNAVC